MDPLFYWTGVVVWVAAALLFVRLAYEGGKAFCVAVDWMTWQMAVCRTHGVRVPWLKLPVTLLKRWWHFASHGHENVKWTGERGYWNGFRQWGVHPAEQQKAG